MQYLTFFLNGVEYAVDVRAVETVVEHLQVMAVPTPIDYMKGVMDLRGKIIPVIDLRKKLGLPCLADAEGAYVIVIGAAGGGGNVLTIGTLVDTVSEVVTLDERSIEATQAEETALWQHYVQGVVRFEERMIVVIEVEGLFSMQEIETIRAA